MEHELKTYPEHYAAIEGGRKSVELRLNDRPYQVGDALYLREFEPIGAHYTGCALRVRVTHILSGGVWLSPGYIAMSIRLMGEDGRARVQEDFRKVADELREQARVSSEECDTLRAQLEQTRGERRALCDLLSADPGTIAGQTLVEAVAAIIASRDEAQARVSSLRTLARAVVDSAARDDNNVTPDTVAALAQLRAALGGGG